MNPVLQTLIEDIKTLPPQYHEVVRRAIERAKKSAQEDEEYRAYIQEGIDAGMADVKAGRVMPLDQAFDKMYQDFHKKYGTV